MGEFGHREGEVALARDPAADVADAGVVFIGHVVSPWLQRAECPKNMGAARERGVPASLFIRERFRPGLGGLERFSHGVVLTWLDRSPRDLIVQWPRHAEAPRGTFSLRSPARPNPIGMHVVRIVKIHRETGRIDLDAIDVLDGTPVIDLKPYFPSADAIGDATTGPA